DICVAQAQHGSAPDIAGQGIANPTSLILSAAMLLGWRGRRDGNDNLVAAEGAIVAAVDRVLDQPSLRTRDLGGTASTKLLGNAVCAAIVPL
ncbi:MAG: isocitrate/isopropylmalate family dehydrogenase, partial [Alphaproteobacteria bacterium]